jgi:hypothetical protein
MEVIRLKGLEMIKCIGRRPESVGFPFNHLASKYKGNKCTTFAGQQSSFLVYLQLK